MVLDQAGQLVSRLVCLVLLALVCSCGGTAFSAGLLGRDAGDVVDGQPLEETSSDAGQLDAGDADASAPDTAAPGADADAGAGDVVDAQALDVAADVVDEPCFTTPNNWCTAGGIGGNPVPCAGGAWSCAAGLCTSGLCTPGEACEPSQGGAAGVVERCAH